MRERSHHLLTRFAVSTNFTLWKAWCYQQWPIATTNPKDERGRERETERNYLDDYHVPPEHHAEAMALQYVDILRVSFFVIMDMDYAEFVKLSLLHKAVTMRRPAKFMSDHEYYLENTRRKFGF